MTALAVSQSLSWGSVEVAWNDFQEELKESPEVLSPCWLLYLHSVVQLIHSNKYKIILKKKTAAVLEVYK